LNFFTTELNSETPTKIKSNTPFCQKDQSPPNMSSRKSVNGISCLDIGRWNPFYQTTKELTISNSSKDDESVVLRFIDDSEEDDSVIYKVNM